MAEVSLAAFLVAATLMVLTPGLDTVLVLRTAASEGPRPAMLAGIGIGLGCIGWGLVVAVGLGALLAASQTAYDVLRWIGAAYLFYLGVRLLLRPRHALEAAPAEARAMSGPARLLQGLLTNLLNPKVGVFYVSFLPQFITPGPGVASATVLLAAIHALLGVVWFAALVLATRPLARVLARPRVIAWLDRLTGGLFVAFGLRLAIVR